MNLRFNTYFPSILRKFELDGAFTWLGLKSVTLYVPLVEVVSMDYGKYVRGNAKINFLLHVLQSFVILVLFYQRSFF